jgi:hypothetical protein
MAWKRIARDLSGLLGSTAIVASFALAWPGVQVAQADEPLMTVDPVLVEAQNRVARAEAPAAPAMELAKELPGSGPSCANPGTPSTLNDAMIEHQARRMMRELTKQIEAAPPGQPWIARTEQGVVLNGRGYNYHPTRQAGAQ